MAQNQSRKSSSNRNPIARLLKHFTPQQFKDKTIAMNDIDIAKNA